MLLGVSVRNREERVTLWAHRADDPLTPYFLYNEGGEKLNFFNGNGNPLDDDRLTLSGTTPAGQQQYRIWHDSQQVLVPKGQSTTKPLMPENVQVNTGVFGAIQDGYYKDPVIEFRNTTNFDLFDRIFMAVYRYELPDDDVVSWPTIDVTRIRTRYNIFFTVPLLGITGRSGGIVDFVYNGNGANGKPNYITPVLHFDDYNNTHLRGDFILVTNPTAGQQTIGAEFTTAKFLQPVNLPIYAIINNVRIINGNSEMKVILKNSPYTVTLQTFDFEILRGE